MKKLILALLFISSSALAKIEIPVIWPFALGVSTSHQIREIISQSNQAQSKYYFIFQHQPGAGGAIAAAHVAKNDQLSILISSSSFFTNFYLAEKKLYRFDEFSMLGAPCINQPILLLSKKYQNFNEMLKNNNLSVGITPGSFDIVLHEINSQLGSNKLRPVYYLTRDRWITDLHGDHIDAAIGYHDQSSYGFHVIGTSGSRPIGGWRTFESQNIKNLDTVTHSFYFFSSSKILEDIKKELSQILNAAIMTSRSVSMCKNNHGIAQNMLYPDTNIFMSKKINFWKQKIDEYQKSITETK